MRAARDVVIFTFFMIILSGMILILNDVSIMKLSSPSFKENTLMNKIFTCDGENVNPELLIEEAPKETKSFVIIVDDPDAMAGDFIHWIAWNIQPHITRVKEDHIGLGVEGINDFGKRGYGGPCPAQGAHRYQFKLYALDKMLDLNFDTKKQALEVAMQGSILSESILVGIYERD